MLDEIRQILKPKGTLKGRLSIWWSDIWNKFDCFGFLIFVLSIIYRLILITQGRVQRLPKVKGVSGIQPLDNKLKPDKMNPQLIAGFKEQPSAAHSPLILSSNGFKFYILAVILFLPYAFSIST